MLLFILVLCCSYMLLFCIVVTVVEVEVEVEVEDWVFISVVSSVEDWVFIGIVGGGGKGCWCCWHTVSVCMLPGISCDECCLSHEFCAMGSQPIDIFVRHHINPSHKNLECVISICTCRTKNQIWFIVQRVPISQKSSHKTSACTFWIFVQWVFVHTLFLKHSIFFIFLDILFNLYNNNINFIDCTTMNKISILIEDTN